MLKPAEDIAPKLDVENEFNRYIRASIASFLKQQIRARAMIAISTGNLVPERATLFQQIYKDLMRDPHLKEALKKSEISEEDHKAYLNHYWNQLYDKKETPFAILRADIPNEVTFESNEGLTSNKVGSIDMREILPNVVTNWEELEAKIEAQKEGLQEALENGSITVLANHSSWMNLPYFSELLRKTLNLDSNQISIIKGPALATYEQGFNMSRNVETLKVIPPTPNGQLPESIKTVQDRITMKSGREMIKRLRKPGHIIICCPFGTTDTKESTPKGTQYTLEFSDTVTSFIEGIKKKTTIWPVGTNDAAIFNGSRRPKPGRSEIGLGSLVEPKNEKTGAEIIQEIACLITNREGEMVASTKHR